MFEKMLEMTIYGILLSLRDPGMRLGEWQSITIVV